MEVFAFFSDQHKTKYKIYYAVFLLNIPHNNNNLELKWQ